MGTETYPHTERAERARRPDPGTHGEGWLAFAVAYLGLAGTVNLIYGIAALAKKSYFHPHSLLWAHLATWAWISIVLGALLLGAAALIVARSAFGAALGIMFASMAFIANFLAVGAYPVWSVIAMTIDGLVIWGLAINMSRTLH